MESADRDQLFCTGTQADGIRAGQLQPVTRKKAYDFSSEKSYAFTA